MNEKWISLFCRWENKRRRRRRDRIIKE